MDFTQPDMTADNQPIICLETFQTAFEVQENGNCESEFTATRNDLDKLDAKTEAESLEELQVAAFIPKLYVRRWAVLASYCFLTISNLSSWFAFSAVSNILQIYYDIDLIQVNWLAMSFSTVSIILMIPSYHLLEKIGLDRIMVLAGFFNAFGCCVRYAGYSIQGVGYLFLLIGSIICAISTSAFLFLPSKLAAVWFGEKERAKATSVAISADSLGMALSYFLPTSIIKNRSSLEEIEKDIGKYLLGSSVESVIIFLFICISMRDRPPTPPSYSESKKVNTNMEAQIHSGISGYKVLLKNINFHTILNIHGVLFGVESVFLIALNEMLIGKYPGYEFEIGVMASIGLVFSIPTSFLIGFLLDRTHAFKRITLTTTGLCSLFTALLSVFFYLNTSFYVLFVTYLAIVSIFCTYYTTAFDHCAELTYPISEAQSGVILLWVAQVYSLIFEQAASLILFHIGPNELLFCVLGLYCLIFVLSFFVKDRGPRPSYFDGDPC